MHLNLKNLEKLYFDGTKHAVYQNIPQFIQDALSYSVKIDESWRGDTARYKNLLKNLNLDDLKTIGDIGANTGFFTLSLAHQFKDLMVYAYEGNPNHYHFIQTIAQQFQLKNVQVINRYIDWQGLDSLEKHDCLLNYNVLHHAGVDFDEDLVDLNSFYGYAEKYLQKLSFKSKKMIFQMGFNWGGDKTKPIVDVGNDFGKINLMSNIFRKSGWLIDRIFTVRQCNEYKYFAIDQNIIKNLNDHSLKGKSELKKYFKEYDLSCFSEFYRRPIFYLYSENLTAGM